MRICLFAQLFSRNCENEFLFTSDDGRSQRFPFPVHVHCIGSFKWLRSVSRLLSRVVFSRDQDSLDGYTDAENDFCRGLTETDRIHQASHFDIV